MNAALQWSGKKCTGTAPYTYTVGRADDADIAIHLWLVRLPKTLPDYLPK